VGSSYARGEKSPANVPVIFILWGVIFATRNDDLAVTVVRMIIFIISVIICQLIIISMAFSITFRKGSKHHVENTNRDLKI
jgi:hypothetical protein